MTETAVVKVEEQALMARERWTARDTLALRLEVQDVMRQVLHQGIDYGKIPGTKKNTLLKPGAEKLLATFRLARRITTVCESLGAGDFLYTAHVSLVHGPSGILVGEGVGTCSSLEQKWAWRAPKCPEELEDAKKRGRTRITWRRSQERSRGFYQEEQVREDPEDKRQTIMAMAVKRAMIDATRSGLAASDIFEAPEVDPKDVIEEMVDEGLPEQRKGPKGFPLALDLIPLRQGGHPYFEGGWKGWKWSALAGYHEKFLRKEKDASPLLFMIEDTSCPEINREMAEKLIAVIATKLAAAAAAADPQHDSVPPEEEFNLDDIPF